MSLDCLRPVRLSHVFLLNIKFIVNSFINYSKKGMNPNASDDVR